MFLRVRAHENKQQSPPCASISRKFLSMLGAVSILPDSRRPARLARAVTLPAVPFAGQDDRADTLAGAA